MMLSAARYCSVAALRASGRTTRIASSPLRAVPGFRPPARRTRKMGTGGGASLLCVSAAEASTSKKGGGVGAAPAYPPLRVTAPGRVVALGDIHGDIGQARRALSIAGVLGAGGDAVNPEWVGGNTTVVQVGDVLDRGDDEIAILILLQKLHKQAEKQGGAVYILNGNHEVLNVSGDFRYVTQGAFQESMRFGEHLVNLFGKAFEDAFGGAEEDARKKQVKARIGLFSPGGPLAQQLAMNSTVLIVNDTVFAHGGLLPRHVEFGLERLNNSVSDWMRGKEITDEKDRTALGMAIGSVKDSVVWNRTFGTENFMTEGDRERACATLGQTLDAIDGAKRLVVGHTPQMGGCNNQCDGRIWRIDVGMSFGVVGADPEVLEIDGDSVRVLTANVPAAVSKL
mmetsp:Transcript_44754/g.71843  ORF Transcript_44754/g.71843 Transcript_44754/m.71843 type:complete len:397 (-) Transcript_44754:464-1654(-)